MNSLKRIFVSIKSQIDHVADEFENHEALASAAIHDLQEIARTTRLHLHRVSKMSEHYQQQCQTQQEQAERWSQRAIKAKKEDEQKALECVRRMRQAQRQSAALEQQYQESTANPRRSERDPGSAAELEKQEGNPGGPAKSRPHSGRLIRQAGKSGSGGAKYFRALGRHRGQ